MRFLLLTSFSVFLLIHPIQPLGDANFEETDESDDIFPTISVDDVRDRIHPIEDVDEAPVKIGPIPPEFNRAPLAPLPDMARKPRPPGFRPPKNFKFIKASSIEVEETTTAPEKITRRRGQRRRMGFSRRKF